MLCVFFRKSCVFAEHNGALLISKKASSSSSVFGFALSHVVTSFFNSVTQVFANFVSVTSAAGHINSAFIQLSHFSFLLSPNSFESILLPFSCKIFFSSSS
jgi:hypothetical protein